MSTTYQVNVNQKNTFDIDLESFKDWDIESLQHAIYHVIHNNENFEVKILESNLLTKKYELLINHNYYSVTISDELDKLIQKMGIKKESAKIIRAIQAPMPGLVLDILVSVGQEVNIDDTLLILEAMKMENTYKSPRTGVVKSILISKGQAIEKGQTLIEFE